MAIFAHLKNSAGFLGNSGTILSHDSRVQIEPEKSRPCLAYEWHWGPCIFEPVSPQQAITGAALRRADQQKISDPFPAQHLVCADRTLMKNCFFNPVLGLCVIALSLFVPKEA